MTTLADLSAERARLLAELEAVEAGLRAVAVDAVAGGEPIARVARECGVTRPTLYAWVRQNEEPRMVRRLAELDAKWAKLVDAVAGRDELPAELSRKGRRVSGLQAEARRRNGQAGKRARKGLKPLAAPSVVLRDFAEAKLLSLVADKADQDAVFGAIRGELDEAWEIRQALESRQNARAGLGDV